jgi:hypothetical protein
MRILLSATIPLLALAFGGAASAEHYAVVVHRSNPATSVRLAELRSLFTGATRQWPNGSKVVLVERETGSPVLGFLLEHILDMSPSEYKRRLENIEYMVDAPVTLKVLRSDEMACKFVFNVPGAIALIGAQSLSAPECGSVQVVRIEGKLPNEEGYKLR